MKIPSFPFGCDYLSVWKRTEFVDIDGDDYSRLLSFLNVKNESEDEDEADCWADIPEDERIMDFAAPAFAELLYAY